MGNYCRYGHYEEGSDGSCIDEMLGNGQEDYVDEMLRMERESEEWMERAAYGLDLRDELGPEAEDEYVGWEEQ